MKSTIEVLEVEHCGLTSHALALLKTNLDWFCYLKKIEMKETDTNFDFKEIYLKILMRAKYEQIDKMLENNMKLLPIPTFLVELMPKDL